MPPEHHIFNPADQSVDKSPCKPSTATEYSFAVKKILEKSWASPGSGSIHRMNEDLPLPKKGRENLASLLADLLGFPSADRQPEANTSGLNLYESMSPAFGNELQSAPTGTCATLQDWQQDGRAVIYENCSKCQRERCQPPPRVLPAEMYRNRNTSSSQNFASELHLKMSQEHEVAVNEGLLYQAHSDGSQSVDRQCQYEEMNGRSVTSEGKMPLQQFPSQLITKLLQFLWCPFPPWSFGMDLLFDSAPVLSLSTIKRTRFPPGFFLFNQLLVFSSHSVMFLFLCLYSSAL